MITATKYGDVSRPWAMGRIELRDDESGLACTLTRRPVLPRDGVLFRKTCRELRRTILGIPVHECAALPSDAALLVVTQEEKAGVLVARGFRIDFAAPIETYSIPRPRPIEGQG